MTADRRERGENRSSLPGVLLAAAQSYRGSTEPGEPVQLTGQCGARGNVSKKKNGRLVVARRPFPIGLSKVEALLPPFFSHLPPVGCFAASGGRGGALVRSPGRMAIPPGSSIRALRVRSGRGPTFRTAPRGARSGRVEHATGFTCSSRGDHQDHRMPEPLVASAFSPDIPLEPACWPPLRLGVSVRILPARGD
jgi:hypothetical protein